MHSNRYFSYNNYLQNLFGCRVYKVAVDAGFSCPNRDGSKGFGGCTFCDERGSSSRTNEISTGIKEQVLSNIKVRKSRYGAQKFIAHFQSFTNTYGSIERLKQVYDEAIFAHPDIVGLAISTRSDCVDEEKLALIASYREFLPYVNIEFGMQTINNNTLKLINRLETHEDFLRSIELTQKYKIDTCIHVILGLPNETREDVLNTADTLAKLKVHGVKIHLLIPMEGTVLEKQYNEKLWTPLEFEEYVLLASDFIQRLHPSCVIHRTFGKGHPLHAKGPNWIFEKGSLVMNSINLELQRRNTFQGSEYQF